MKNYYEILEVSQNASEDVIERSFKILEKKYNPAGYPPDMQAWAKIRLRASI